MNIEREIKLQLNPAAARKLARLAPQQRRLASVYYDTPRQQLRRAGIALRLRRDGSRWLQTLKSEVAPHAGLATRAEWEIPVRGKELELGRFPRHEIRKATGVDLAALARRLRPVFETRFSRQSGLVRLQGNGSAELSIDRGLILAARRREAISEVELELKSGKPRALLRFAAQLALPLAYESKAERGYRLAAALPRAPRKWRTPALDPAGTPGATFAALFSAALMQVGINAAGLLESSDPEYLHQMRVGLRRLRSALRAFAPVLDNAKAVKRWLRDLMPPLGAARDWDVFAQTLQEAQARTAILQKVRRRHNAVRRVARDTVSSPKFQSFLLGSLQWLQSEPWRDSSASLERFGAQALERLHRKGVKHADWGGASERHQLRIRVKRLRYACEFFAPCFAPAAVAPYLEQLQALQDILGELNDIAVARALCCEIDAPAPRQLAQREKKLIAALTPAWNRFEKQPRYWRHRG